MARRRTGKSGAGAQKRVMAMRKRIAKATLKLKKMNKGLAKLQKRAAMKKAVIKGRVRRKVRRAARRL